MIFFDKYVSNTTAGSANQLFCRDRKGVGRVFYRLFQGGKFEYSFLFSNIVDSTFSTGAISQKNHVCDEWKISHLSWCVGKTCNPNELPQNGFCQLTFDGKKEKNVMPGEFFCTDDVEIEAETGDFLCLEIAFEGAEIPFHQEINIPTFVLDNGVFVPHKKMPVPQMIGCNRCVKKRIAFLGDSITQGIGTPLNSYAHWNHLIAETLGAEYACWNLGIGYARTGDAASNGSWLFKAKQNDVVLVCLGVNDVMYGISAEEIKSNLQVIVRYLKEAGCAVVLQTLPPFDYDPEKELRWREVNRYILEELSLECTFVFDVVSILGDAEQPTHAKFGGHPNGEGCRLWADALLPRLQNLFDIYESMN